MTTSSRRPHENWLRMPFAWQLVILFGSSVSCSTGSAGAEPIEIVLAMKVGSDLTSFRPKEEYLPQAIEVLGCSDCEILRRRNAFGFNEEYVVSDRVYARMNDSRGIRKVVIVERALVLTGEGTFFTIECELSDEADPKLRDIGGMSRAAIVTKVKGTVLGVEPAIASSSERIRIATYLDRDQAVEMAQSLAGSAGEERLTASEATAEKSEHIKMLAEEFRVSKCQPESPRAIAQKADFETILRFIPSIVDEIDCSQ